MSEPAGSVRQLATGVTAEPADGATAEELLTINFGPHHPATHGVLRVLVTLRAEEAISSLFRYVLGIWGNKKPLNGDVAIGRMPRSPEAEGTVYWSSGGNAIKRHPTSADTVPFYSWMSKQKELWDSMWVQQGVPPNRRSLSVPGWMSDST